MNLNMLLKLGNLICAHADNAKFIYKPRNICSQPKKKYIKTIIVIIHICVQKYIYMPSKIGIS